MGRILLGASGLLAVSLDPTDPAALAPVVYGVLGAFLVYAGAVLVLLRHAASLSVRQTWLIHALDLLWALLLTMFSEGPVSPLMFFFLFAQVAAAYRWGLREAMLTAVIAVAAMVAGVSGVAAWTGQTSSFDVSQGDLNRTVFRVGSLLITGFLLGYLSEEQRRYRHEMEVIADAARRARLDIDLGSALTSIARIACRTFSASAVDLVLKDVESPHALRCRVEAHRAGPHAGAVPLAEVDEAQWLFPDQGPAWQLTAGSSSARVTAPGSWALGRAVQALPEGFGSGHAWQSLEVGNMGAAGEWQARVFVWDRGSRRSYEHELHFLEGLLELVTPAVTSVLLMRRLHLRAGAAERARVARELHDGTIQALFGLEMRVAALLRSEPDAGRWRSELQKIQEAVRTEIQALRELMLALRPIELDSGDQLPDVLASLVERFRRDSGMGARFVAVGRPAGLPAESAVEVVRIVQEALVNARKHSRARNVLVRLSCSDADCRLLIEDDGVGFPFEGRLTISELDARRIGPTIIKERARIAGAALVLESTPGEGASLELDIPLVHHA